MGSGEYGLFTDSIKVYSGSGFGLHFRLMLIGSDRRDVWPLLGER
jgi:hypothetical protein